MQKTKRFPFTELENQIIRDSVKIFGEDWETISKKLPGRTPKQCHDRYINYLREGLKCGPWTSQEDETLLTMYKAIGPKWSKMMSNLPGRSGNDIKNRWHKHLAKKSNQPFSVLNANNLNQPMSINNEFSETSRYPFFGIRNPQSYNSMTNVLPQISNNFHSQLTCSNDSIQKKELEQPLKEPQANEHSLPKDEKSDFDAEFNFFDQGLYQNFYDNFFEQNSQEIPHRDTSHNKQVPPPVRIIKKIDISSNNYEDNNNLQNQQSNLSSTIGWDEFDMQDFVENLNNIDLDFY